MAKARKLLKSPQQLLRAINKSAASYIKGLQYNEEGEVIEPKTLLYLDEEKIKEEARLDGYYAIVTSELELDDLEVIRLYHDLWKIEETFKISKAELRTRPVHVSLEAHIEAHFLTCFVALVLVRALELKLNQANLKGEQGPQVFSTFSLLDSLRQFACSHVAENYYTFHYIDDNIKAIEQVLGLELDRKYRKRSEIRNVIANAKK